jgi:hypothetical protein
MLRESKGVESKLDRSQDDILKIIFRMPTELARMGMMRVHS